VIQPRLQVLDIQGRAQSFQHRPWGAKIFRINAEATCREPLQEAGAAVDLTDVVEEARVRGLKFLLIRFQTSFATASNRSNEAVSAVHPEFNYQGKYRGVFPSRSISARSRRRKKFSTPAALRVRLGRRAANRNCSRASRSRPSRAASSSARATKTPSFQRMALMGIKLGKRVIMVVGNSRGELKQIPACRGVGVEPLIGSGGLLSKQRRENGPTARAKMRSSA